MEFAVFYIITCLFMGFSTWIAGLQWCGADGVQSFLKLIFVERPFILVSTIAIFVISGVHMHIGKSFFNITYFENGIIWLSTSWVSFAVLWLAYGLKPSLWELVGSAFGQVGLFIALIGRAASN